MKINISHYTPVKPYSNKPIKAYSACDSVVLSSSSKQNVAFGNGIFSFFSKIRPTQVEEFETNEQPSEFAKDLARGIEKVMEKKIPAKNLTNIMSPEEFKEILPELEARNFVFDEKNVDSGFYCADLDYPSSFSYGEDSIFDILDKATARAQEYYKKTGKDFIFALTDRDSVEGLQHIVRVFGENPGKYKHLKLLPALKLSFAHEASSSPDGYENSEMLVYGVNPYSDNVIDYIENTIRKRREMTINFIRDVNILYPEFAYSVIEFAEQNNLKYIKDYTVANLYWRAREYAQTKGDTEISGVSLVPKEILKEAENILDNLSQVYLGSDETSFSSLGSKIIKDTDVNQTVKKVFNKYSTHKEDSGVVSASENFYSDMVDCFASEPNKPVMALAAPYYFTQYFGEENSENFEEVIKFFNGLKENSAGMLLALESVAPEYKDDQEVKPEVVSRFNQKVKAQTNLYDVGGSLVNADV